MAPWGTLAWVNLACLLSSRSQRETLSRKKQNKNTTTTINPRQMIPKEWPLRLATSPHNHTHIHAHVTRIHCHLHTYDHTYTKSRSNPHHSLLICPFRHYTLCLFLFKRLDQEPPTTGLGSPVYHRVPAAPGSHSSNTLVFIFHNRRPRQSASPRRRENN